MDRERILVLVKQFFNSFIVVQSPSRVWLFITPWIATHQASLSPTISQSLPKFMFIASVMPSSHLILWCPLFLLPSIFLSIKDFSNVICSHQMTKILELQLQHQSLDEGEGGEWKSWLKTKYHAIGPIIAWQIEGEKVEVVTDFLLGSRITADCDCSHEIRRRLLLDRKVMTQCVEKQRHYSADKGTYHQGCGLPSGHIWLWELDHKEGRLPKNWCLQTVVLEKTPERPLNSKEIKPVNLKGDQPWIPTGRTDLKLKPQYFGRLMWTDDSSEKSQVTKSRTRLGDWTTTTLYETNITFSRVVVRI